MNLFKTFIFTLYLPYSYALINGEVAAQNDYPAQVRIADTCSATKIARNYLLTAAHCLYSERGSRSNVLKSGKKVVLKSHYLGRKRRVRIKKIHIYPDYKAAIKKYRSRSKAARHSHDIAIIKISNEENIPIANLVYLKSEINPTTELVMTGSGCLKKDSSKSGPFKFGNTLVNEDKYYTSTNERILTTSSNDAKLCAGDSGGGVYLGLDVVAVNSAYITKGDREVNLHVNLARVQSWIENILLK